MATIRIVLGIFCLTLFGQFIEPNGGFLRKEGWKVEGLEFRGLAFRGERLEGLAVEVDGLERRVNGPAVNWKLLTATCDLVEGGKVEGLGFSGERLGVFGGRVNGSATVNWKLQAANRKLILNIARSQLGIREATGKNDGVEVEQYLIYANNKKGEPWCASFVSWVYGQAGYPLPRTAWSPALFPLDKRTDKPQPADVFGIYFPKLKRIAHCGIVEGSRANWIYTIEGNTNLAGSREGDGVYRKLRHRRSIKYYANWIDEKGKGGLR